MRDKPSEPAEFDVYATDYDRAVNAATAFTGLKVDLFTHVKADYLRDILATSFVNSAAVDMLDIGCGTGNIHRHIQGHVRSLSGTDVSATSIGVAQQCNPGVTYKVYDGERLPWPDHSFDLAFAICVLHHVPPQQWAGFVSEMRRVLRPGGVALVFEHNSWNPLTARVVSNCEFDKNAVLLPARQTERLLVEQGFGKVDTSYFLAIPMRGRWVRRTEALFRHIPIGAQYFTRGMA